MIAISVCALMLFFAVGSKVAAYHTKELAARSIAATKVWKAKSATSESVPAGVNTTLQAAVELVFLLSSCLVLAPLPLKRESPSSHLPTEDFAALAMRPPPVL